MKDTTAERKRGRLGAVVGVLTASCLVVTACADDGGDETDPETYYAGKTIELFVPFAAGGGTDTAARVLAPLLSERIPGNPTVIVVNEPSTGGILGSNAFANGGPYGGERILVSSSSTHSSYLVGDPTVDFDFQSLRPLLGMSTGSLVFVHGDTGISGPSELIGPVDEELIVGGQTPSGSDLRALLALDLLEVEYRAIFGYQGSGDKRPAFERAEITMMLDNVLSFDTQMGPLVETGTVVPVFSQGLMVGEDLVRVPSLPDLPTPPELYEELYGSVPSGPGWDAYETIIASTDSLSKALWLHSEDPDIAFEILDTAIRDILDDPDTWELVEEDVFAGTEPLLGDDLNAVVDGMANPDPEALSWLLNYLDERWDETF